MNRLASILGLTILTGICTSCESLWLDAYRHQGHDPVPPRHKAVSDAEHEDNLRWMREHYLDVPLTRVLNAPAHPIVSRKVVAFEQPLLFPIGYRGKSLYQNYEDWTVTVGGYDYTVPQGLVVDGASVPRACWWFMPPDGLHRGAALFHDWGYILQGRFPDGPHLTKAQIDNAFYDIMVESGVSPKRAVIAYEGVHLAGGPAWASIESPLILPIDRHRMAAPQFLQPRTAFSHIYAP